MSSENNGIGNITNSGGDKPWSSTVIPANPSFGPWIIVSRKGRGKSTVVVFLGGSRFEVLENEDNEDRALSCAQSKNPATSSNLPVPTAIPTSLDPVKHTAIKFLPPHDFHSDPKDISLDPTRPNKKLADPNIPIDDRDKPSDKDLEMDANDEDDPDDKKFKDKCEKSDSESDDSGTSLEDEVTWNLNEVWFVVLLKTIGLADKNTKQLYVSG
ncbi:hypothetical protein WN943_027377 [Citrus x changshan-huyou]